MYLQLSVAWMSCRCHWLSCIALYIIVVYVPSANPEQHVYSLFVFWDEHPVMEELWYLFQDFLLLIMCLLVRSYFNLFLYSIRHFRSAIDEVYCFIETLVFLYPGVMCSRFYWQWTCKALLSLNGHWARSDMQQGVITCGTCLTPVIQESVVRSCWTLLSETGNWCLSFATVKPGSRGCSQWSTLPSAMDSTRQWTIGYIISLISSPPWRDTLSTPPFSSSERRVSQHPVPWAQRLSAPQPILAGLFNSTHRERCSALIPPTGLHARTRSVARALGNWDLEGFGSHCSWKKEQAFKTMDEVWCCCARHEISTPASLKPPVTSTGEVPGHRLILALFTRPRRCSWESGSSCLAHDLCPLALQRGSLFCPGPWLEASCAPSPSSMWLNHSEVKAGLNIELPTTLALSCPCMVTGLTAVMNWI